ncbi:putative zinc ribbon domain protein [bacterium BMS3Bbin01]|nr:putative zinc ribbon domain protein [bacterium BMS3Bbin01]
MGAMSEFRSLADLLELQRVDSEIDRLLERRASLPELEHYKSAHLETEAIRRKLSEKETLLREIDLDLDRTNGELEMAETKMGQQEQRLYAGGMSAKETENLRLDVQSRRKRVRETEDRVLELLQLKETLENEAAVIRDQLAAAEAEEQRLSGIIKEAWKDIDAELARREERKTAAITLIPPDLLELYEQLRERKEGVAIGRLDETGVCGGCHLKLSAAERRQALAVDPPRCIHCRRILVP